MYAPVATPIARAPTPRPQVTSAGGRYRYQDDQETPDTHIASFDFPGGRSITWEGFSCNQIPLKTIEVLFQGETGSLAIIGNGYAVVDPKGKEGKKVSGTSNDAMHVDNLLAAIRSGMLKS